MLATALAAESLPPLPPPDRQRLGQYHSDPLLTPRLDLSALAGVTDQGAPSGFAVAEFRLGGTFAVGVGGSDNVLNEGPTLTWAWRVFSYQHYWSLDVELRTPVLDINQLQFGAGGDMSPRPDGRIALRVRAMMGLGGFTGEMGLVVRAL